MPGNCSLPWLYRMEAYMKIIRSLLPKPNSLNKYLTFFMDLKIY